MELDFSKDIERVPCNTLILCGENDKVNKKSAVKLVEQMSKGEFRTVKGAGHEVNMEASEKLASIILDFLSKFKSILTVKKPNPLKDPVFSDYRFTA